MINMEFKRDELPTDAAYLLRGLSFPGVDENQELEIAQRSLAIRIIASQIAFFAACILKNEEISNVSDITHQHKPLVSVIGCGMVGSQILNTLLSIGWPPSCLGACARNRDHFAQFESKGVQCSTDATTLCEFEKDGLDGRARIVVIAVPYAQLRALTSILLGPRCPNTVIVSVVAGTTYQKIHQLLPNFPHVIRTAIQLSRLMNGCGGSGRVATEKIPLLDDQSLQMAALHLASEEINYIISVFEELFVCIGDSREQARRLSLEVILGAQSQEIDVGNFTDGYSNVVVSAHFHQTFSNHLNLSLFK